MKLNRLSQENRLYQCPVPIIGLTGGIATGKSTVSTLLKNAGHPLICADELIKKIYQKTETTAFIQKLSPESIDEQGQINFKHLRQNAFSDPRKLTQLEAFLYPQLPQAFCEEIPPNAKYLFYDVPLLFEKKLDTGVDATLLVYSPRQVQIKRLMERDSIDQQLAEKMLQAQINIEEKKEKSSFILRNTGTKEDLEEKLQQLLQCIFT